MVFSQFLMQEDGATDQQQHNGTFYEQSTSQAPNVGGTASFGTGNNSVWQPKTTLGSNPSAYYGSQTIPGMLGSFAAQQQAFSNQPIMDDNTNLFAAMQNQSQSLQPAFQNMMGGSSLTQYANTSSFGGSMGIGGIFNAVPSRAASHFAAMSNGNAFFLQQQQQLQFEQQQWLLQQQQLQQQLQQNQLQFQQFQHPVNFSTLQSPESPSISSKNAPLPPALPLYEAPCDTNNSLYVGEASDDGRMRTSRRTTISTPKSSKLKSFPEKLMQAMLENRDEDAVGWLPDGKSFVIVSADKFVGQVLDKVFKQAKYSSFVRKLHRWGFVRLTSGTGTDCFHHPLFQKNRKDLASKIRSISNDPKKKGQLPFKLSSSKPPSLAGVEKYVRTKTVTKLVASETPPEADSVSIRSATSEPNDSVLDIDATEQAENIDVTLTLEARDLLYSV